MYLTTNILQRVFQLGIGYEATATCFTIDVDNKQYLCTAKHVLEGRDDRDIRILHDGRWKSLDAELIGFGADGSDIAVLAPSRQVSPSYPVVYSWKGLQLGEEMRVLGFPYGLRMDFDGDLNRSFPWPLVKGAICSALVLDEPRHLLLDFHNNPGFSGGPVVYQPRGNHEAGTPGVAGVVSAYHSARSPVMRKADGADSDFESVENTGIAIAYRIEYALDVIGQNPIGAEIAV